MDVLNHDGINCADPRDHGGASRVAAEEEVGGAFHGSLVFRVFGGDVGGDDLAGFRVDISPSHGVEPALLWAKPERAVSVVLLSGHEFIGI